MAQYRIIYEDPNHPDDPAVVVTPSDNWLKTAMAGKLPPIETFLKLKLAEEKSIQEGTHDSFNHNPEDYLAQFTAPRIGPLTEEEAMEYLLLKDVPMQVWGKQHNKPMFCIVKADQVPCDRTFRDAWRLAA